MESNTTLVQCFPAHEAYPDSGGPFPAVILLHGLFGLNAFVRNAANRIAAEGFYALAPDFYATPTSYVAVAPGYMRKPTGGEIAYADRDAAFDHAQQLPDDHAMKIFGQALAYLTVRSAAKGDTAAIVGFANGARLALLGAALYPDQVRACAGYAPFGTQAGTRPGDALRARLDAIRCPILLFYGALDKSVHKDEGEALVAHLRNAGKQVDAHLFPEAEDDFYLTDWPNCDISSSRKAWAATLALLHRTASSW